MNCRPHGYHRVRLTASNSQMLKRKPSKANDSEQMQIAREKWDTTIAEEKRT